MNNPTFLKLEDPVLRDVFSSILTKEIKHKVIAAILNPLHQETLSVLVENLARLQVNNNEIFTFLAPDNFDIPQLRRKVLTWMEANGIEESKYWNNVQIYSINAGVKILHEEKNVINLPVPPTGIFEAENLSNLLEIFNKHHSKLVDNVGEKRSIIFGFMLSLVSRLNENFKKAPDFYLRAYNWLKNIENAVFIFSTYNTDENLDGLYKISNMIFEIDIIRGVPFLNCKMPEIPNLYSLLMEEQNNKVCGLKLYPIV